MITEYQRCWAKDKWKNDLSFRLRLLANQAMRRTKLRRILKDKKNRPCMDCQGWFEPCQMEFDHRDPAKKKWGISSMVTSRGRLKDLLEEISKCDVVCANCHRLRTRKQYEAGIFKNIRQRIDL